MQELFPEGRIFTPISYQPKKVTKEQGNVEAVEPTATETWLLDTSLDIADVSTQIPSSKNRYSVTWSSSWTCSQPLLSFCERTTQTKQIRHLGRTAGTRKGRRSSSQIKKRKYTRSADGREMMSKQLDRTTSQTDGSLSSRRAHLPCHKGWKGAVQSNLDYKKKHGWYTKQSKHSYNRDYRAAVQKKPINSNSSSRSNNRSSSSKVLALKQKNIPTLVELGEFPCEMKRGGFGGVTTHGMIGPCGTKTKGANLSRISEFGNDRQTDGNPSVTDGEVNNKK